MASGRAYFHGAGAARAVSWIAVVLLCGCGSQLSTRPNFLCLGGEKSLWRGYLHGAGAARVVSWIVLVQFRRSDTQRSGCGHLAFFAVAVVCVVDHGFAKRN